MDFSEKTASISPIKMNSKSKFSFECHSDVDCFTLCCRGTKVTLTPYDIIQLKNKLSITSREFLALYTKPYLLEKTDLPMVTLKLSNDEYKSCPFVVEKKGCVVYENRPTSCRYYPLGVATTQYNEKVDKNDFFFFVNESHCNGFDGKKEWTVGKWRKNQKVDIRDEINSEWIDLIVRKRSFPSNIKLVDQAKRMFFLVSYDIDKFREFVFKSSFLQRNQVENEVIMKINNDDIELLNFGLSWLKKVLFNENH